MTITEQDLTKEQKEVFDNAIKWANDKHDKLLKIGGVAGSGKSVLISLIAKRLSYRSIAFCAYTGKAANNLHQKLVDANISPTYCGTIHGLMYVPIINTKTLKVTGWRKKNKIDEDLIIIDEGSMVGGKLFKDLQSYGKKILAVGDHKQLSPVEGADIGLMKHPDLTLTEIHRVALENPIIQLSGLIRTGQDYSNFKCDNDKIQYVKFGSKQLNEIIYNAFDNVENRLNATLLCYFNRSRVRYNNICRKIIGYKDETPIENDIVICLKNTSIDDDVNVFNGMRGLVEDCLDENEAKYSMSINFKDDRLKIVESVSKYQFNQEKTFSSMQDVQKYNEYISNWSNVGMLFDFGYCLSYYKCVHPETLVETPNGLYRISELQSTGQIATPNGFANYNNLVFNQETDMLEIETKDGYRLRSTLDHGVDVWDNKFGYIRKEAKDIKKDDIVRLKLGAVWDNQNLIKLHDPIIGDVRDIIYNIPKFVDEDFAEFLGIMVANGTLFRIGFRVAKRHKEFTDRFEELCIKLFNCKVQRYLSLNAYQANISSCHISRWLNYIDGLQPNKKAIPKIILQSSLKIQAAFLRGMFEDGSVYIKYNKLDYIELYSCFHNIIRDIKTMLLRFDIISGIVRTSTGYRIQIYGYNAAKFANKIGLISKCKKEKLLFPGGKETKYTIPITINELTELVGDNFKLNQTEKRCSKTYRITRYSIENILKRCTVKNDMWYKINDRLKFHHSKVEFITKYRGQSVCLEVPKEHQFIQDGFCGWNCQGSAFNTVILFIERSKYQDEEEFNRAIYTAVTRSSDKLIIVR